MYIKDKEKTKIDFSGDELSFEINADIFKWRVLILYLIVVGCFLYLFIGAFQLQIVEGEKDLLVATRTNQSQEKTLASRGLIFDINGSKLASNTASYSLYVDPTELKINDEDTIISTIANLIQVDAPSFLASFKSKMYDSAGVRSKVNRVTLKSGLSFDQYFAVLSRIDEFPGVKLNVEAVRNYTSSKVFSNIIGYIGDPTQNDINNGIYSESQVGKTGIESEYDNYLRGTEGTIVTETDTLTGKETQSQDTAAEAGNNLYLNIDSTWQTYLYNIVAKQTSTINAFGAAGVIMNANTGEIKAMVTYPSYDNNLFANGISASDYSSLINDIHTPLFNRAVALQLPPGSIMKIFGAAAALESGTITADTKYLSDRCMDLPGGIEFCEADKSYIGWVNVEEALARSSNIFFCKAMQAMHTVPGYNYYYDIAKSFGIGSQTGIDLTGEASGLLPSAAYKMGLIHQSWYIGDECNTVIGQGYVTVTPLQMTVAVSAIVNGGNILEPHVVNKVVNQSGDTVYAQDTKIIRNVGISAPTLKIIEDGLRLGVTAGTGGSLKNLPGYIITKTGSSDAGEWINGKYYTGAHSWIMGCFEYDGETYCFTVMQQWGGRGYRTVPIMKKFINCVYNNFSDGCENIN